MYTRDHIWRRQFPKPKTNAPRPCGSQVINMYDFVLTAHVDDMGMPPTFVAWTQYGLRWNASVHIRGDSPDPVWQWKICAGEEPTQEQIMAGTYDTMTAAFWAPLKVTMTKLCGSGEDVSDEDVSELRLARKGTMYADTRALGSINNTSVRFGLKICK
jgi:hypothetical protein